MKIIFVVACDLALDSHNYVVVGPETKTACDHAIQLAKSDPEYLSNNLLIVATAGIVSKKYDLSGTYMAQVMRNYLRTQLQYVPIIIRCAKSFNTSGEMKALAQFVSEHKNRRNCVTKIDLAVKWWHGPRSWCLCKYWLWKESVEIPVNLKPCHSSASWKLIAREPFACITNILRLLFLKR